MGTDSTRRGSATTTRPARRKAAPGLFYGRFLARELAALERRGLVRSQGGAIVITVEGLEALRARGLA